MFFSACGFFADGGDAFKGFKRTNSLIGDHYIYDSNGNMTQDKHRSLTMSFNFLNLPQSFTLPAGNITMTYTADGEKLTKVAGATTKNYIGGIEYTGANLEAIYFSEGRCTPNGATAFFYDYTVKDHLGNARVNFRATGASITYLEQLHYYPFGMLIEGLGTVSPTNDYAYNGKELNEDFDLNLSDYGARWYDAAVGRWWNVDPMGEKTASFSTYQYVLNNPLILVDPSGMSPKGAREDAENTEKWMEYGKKLDEERREKKAKEEEKKLPEVWIANVSNETLKTLLQIFNHAADILNKNGFSSLKFNFVDVSEAKRHSETYDYQLFLAIRNDDYNSAIGLSMNTGNKGHVGVFRIDGHPKAGWYSYINLGRSEISQSKNRNYAAGYYMAHELLHQLTGYASYYNDGLKTNKFDHDNSEQNLNMDGRYIVVPNGPSKKLQIAERILTYQKEYLNFFLQKK